MSNAHTTLNVKPIISISYGLAENIVEVIKQLQKDPTSVRKSSVRLIINLLNDSIIYAKKETRDEIRRRKQRVRED